MKQFVLFTVLFTVNAAASSLQFPTVAAPPTVDDFLATPNNIYYCSPSGNNSSGDGSIDNPWVDMIGVNSTVGPGDLIYLRGGTYPAYSLINFSRSQNILSVDGTTSEPIVITNYPGEIAKWNSVDTIWSITLDGDNQKLIGTKVGSQYGIQITGGISVRSDNVQVSGVEFIGGTSNGGDLNPAMLSVPLNDGCDSLIISNCMFRDSVHQSTANRMACIRLFYNSNVIIENNIFLDNQELSGCACIYLKDTTISATIRYNRFIDSIYGISYFGQDPGSNGLEIYKNLFVGVDYSIYYKNIYGGGIRIYKNTAYNIPVDGSFFYYLNAVSSPDENGTDHGEVYSNIIYGAAFYKGYHANSSDGSNLPDYFNYNLWVSSSGRNNLWGDVGYYSNYIENQLLSINYDSSSYYVTVDDDYGGKDLGRYGGNVGGFEFNRKVKSGSGTGSFQ